MLSNTLWLSLININRRKFQSLIFFILALFIANSLFLINISNYFLNISNISEIKRFVYTVIFSALIINLLILIAVSIFSINQRKTEFGILRIYGAKKIDILLLSVWEILIISFAGALSGVLILIILIFVKIIYLPLFFEGVKTLKFIKLIGMGGQTIFGVILIELIITTIALLFYLKRDITDLLRGGV